MERKDTKTVSRFKTCIMVKNQKILAIIPARGGSKGIPGKNIIPVGGKPLIAWTIEAAQKSKYIGKVIVSSDDDEILKVSAKFGAKSIKRPAKLATDTASPEPLIFHALDYLRTKKYIPDIIVYLQPTSPLRDEKDNNDAFNLFFKSKATALNSVYEADKKYLKTFLKNKSGFLIGSVNNKYPFANRQQLPSVYMPNGAIYIIYTKAFKKTGMLFTDKTLPYKMSGKKNFDLDTLDDLKKLRSYFKNKNAK